MFKCGLPKCNSGMIEARVIIFSFATNIFPPMIPYFFFFSLTHTHTNLFPVVLKYLSHTRYCLSISSVLSFFFSRFLNSHFFPKLKKEDFIRLKIICDFFSNFWQRELPVCGRFKMFSVSRRIVGKLNVNFPQKCLLLVCYFYLRNKQRLNNI